MLHHNNIVTLRYCNEVEIELRSRELNTIYNVQLTAVRRYPPGQHDDIARQFVFSVKRKRFSQNIGEAGKEKSDPGTGR